MVHMVFLKAVSLNISDKLMGKRKPSEGGVERATRLKYGKKEYLL